MTVTERASAPAMEPSSGRPPKSSHDARIIPTLEELGVSYDESARCQKLVTLPASTFEDHLAAKQAAREEITTADVLRLANGAAGARRGQEVVAAGAGGGVG